MMPVRSPMTNFRMTVRADCTVSACSPHLQPIKSHAHGLSVAGELAFGQAFPPPPLVAGVRNKFPFHFTLLASLLAFEWQAAGPGFDYTFYVPNRHFHINSKNKQTKASDTSLLKPMLYPKLYFSSLPNLLLFLRTSMPTTYIQVTVDSPLCFFPPPIN